MFRRLLARLGIDPYLVALVATVGVAAILPARGVGADVTNDAVSVAVGLLFFLYGARLSPRAVWDGLLHWRLQSLVFGSTYVLFPLLGLGLTRAFGAWLPHDLILGLMFVCVLPSTVQSSIAFTSIARGNVPAALCSASVSNLFGMVVTPLLVMLLLDSKGVGFSTKALESIAVQLLLPFLAGQVLRPFIGAFLQRHKTLTSLVDRGSILLVVYDAFSEGMVAGIWSKVTANDLILIVVLDVVLLAAVLAITTIVSRRLGFSKEDEIAIVFCGSKKSMASGIPMANILFPGQALGLIVLPLMLFHQAQLFACATLAQRYARRPRQEVPAPKAEPMLTTMRV
ncbi:MULTISPECIES: bile acid:sodium symporter family protein [unclassified Beijerinckia]|uniref:bile acid:sodium symporter family protein n=1 Tax=unclassified Beijerinckia TaxID=2638183 RepID=UPI0008953209|nr:MULTISPECIES: bile acid:sodium symporter family protein [unclassified Beijerinckia]MDH7796589.1 sodium/bile acid cotransporter 7 [Beijerinckia sp. GAS462]SEC51553.1 solute carrier family 10 (sodium/bile acid cotransporter), member 7 [Beijerinckia sp. 28-YEA-48]